MSIEKNPKIFISYSWSSPEHEKWIIGLAERLVADGIDVTIDKWDLKPGHSMYDFMESMVNSKEIDRVLIILDKQYTQKANLRRGGVGTESQIISPEVYKNISQEKFIPIVREKDSDGNPYIPTFLTGRIYIDFSHNDQFEENYDVLIRNIYKRPIHSKPELGPAPKYLFKESNNIANLNKILRELGTQISKDPQNIDEYVKNFLNEFFTELNKLTITIDSNQPNEVGKRIHESIISYTPLRDDFAAFIDIITKTNTKFDIEILIKFLEKLPILKNPQDNRGSWSPIEFDNFRFFIHELFLYTVAIAYKNENYKVIEELIYSSYFFQERFEYSKEPGSYDKFYNYINSIDTYYFHTYSKSYHSPMADIMVTRISPNIDLKTLIESDLLLHYVGKLTNIRWFPITYVYNERDSFQFFDRLISKRHFDKVKSLFNVETPEELKEKLKKLKETDDPHHSARYNNSYNSVTPLFNLINQEKLATVR